MPQCTKSHLWTKSSVLQQIELLERTDSVQNSDDITEYYFEYFDYSSRNYRTVEGCGGYRLIISIVITPKISILGR